MNIFNLSQCSIICYATPKQYGSSSPHPHSILLKDQSVTHMYTFYCHDFGIRKERPRSINWLCVWITSPDTNPTSVPSSWICAVGISIFLSLYPLKYVKVRYLVFKKACASNRNSIENIYTRVFVWRQSYLFNGTYFTLTWTLDPATFYKTYTLGVHRRHIEFKKKREYVIIMF